MCSRLWKILRALLTSFNHRIPHFCHCKACDGRINLLVSVSIEVDGTRDKAILGDDGVIRLEICLSCIWQSVGLSPLLYRNHQVPDVNAVLVKNVKSVVVSCLDVSFRAVYIESCGELTLVGSSFSD